VATKAPASKGIRRSGSGCTGAESGQRTESGNRSSTQGGTATAVLGELKARNLEEEVQGRLVFPEEPSIRETGPAGEDEDLDRARIGKGENKKKSDGPCGEGKMASKNGER